MNLLLFLHESTKLQMSKISLLIIKDKMNTCHCYTFYLPFPFFETINKMGLDVQFASHYFLKIIKCISGFMYIGFLFPFFFFLLICVICDFPSCLPSLYSTSFVQCIHPLFFARAQIISTITVSLPL